MTILSLPPTPKDTNTILIFLSTCFSRIREAFRSLGEKQHGVSTVTGTLDIDTTLGVVSNVVASLVTAPSADAAFVTATYEGKVVKLKVYTSTYTVATVPVVVNWIAFGES